MAKTKARSIFSCQECGAQYSKWQGQCRECGAWNTLVEEVALKESPRGWSVQGAGGEKTLKPVTLSGDFKLDQDQRTSTGFAEVNRVLGGGLVKGSFVLLGGGPGIGKSTLLLQVAGGLSNSGASVLYVSCEESVQQTMLRAHRLGTKSDKVQVISENQLENLLLLAERESPDVLIVDSIQTVFLTEIASAPGSVSQVRECAARLMTLAKAKGITVLLIGHVTKDGTLAGPKVLEHMVDTVLSFEGDSSHHYRLLRSLKNRFGPTHELGVFTMASEGLREVLNPSELFLEERSERRVGSSVFASMEGSRPLLCEVQALAMATPMANPRRTSLGLDVNRVHLLVAVLTKNLPLNLQHSDVFVNVDSQVRSGPFPLRICEYEKLQS
jgi:DNA repair protein RadA/Sms